MKRNVPVCLKDPYIPVYNADRWLALSKLAEVNPEFTAVEIKSFYMIGLIVEICASVDCLLKANNLSEKNHPLAVQIFNAGGRYLPAFGVLASGVELLGRCLTGNKTAQTNENLNVGFYYLVKPSSNPLRSSIPEKTVVVTTEHFSYTIEHLISLRNYAAHGQSVMGEKIKDEITGKKQVIPTSNLPGIDRGVFKEFPKLIGNAIDTYWLSLIDDEKHCIKMGRARLDPYSNRVQPLQHIISYISQKPHPSMGSVFYKFDWI
jgi:hypothetical protein